MADRKTVTRQTFIGEKGVALIERRCLEMRRERHTAPARIVLHKTSAFTDEEANEPLPCMVPWCSAGAGLAWLRTWRRCDSVEWNGPFTDAARRAWHCTLRNMRYASGPSGVGAHGAKVGHVLLLVSWGR